MTAGDSSRPPPRGTHTSSAGGGDLTIGEHEVLLMLVAGAGAAAIAVALVVTPATVRNRIQAVMAKLGAHSRVEAVAITLRETNRRHTNYDRRNP